MPWWIVAYAGFFGLIILVNSMFWFMFRQRVLLVLYHLIAGAYLIFITLAYWTPELRSNFTLLNIPALLLVICADFYFSTRKEKNVDIQDIIPDLDENCAVLARELSVVELAKAFPVLIAAPGYFFGAVLAFEILRKSQLL